MSHRVRLEFKSRFASIEELQSQIDGFVRYYNEVRPHQAMGCPPMHVWRRLDKATPTLAEQQLLAKTRVRHDRVDDTGAVTLRSASAPSHQHRASLQGTARRHLDVRSRRARGHRRRRVDSTPHVESDEELPTAERRLASGGSSVPETLRHDTSGRRYELRDSPTDLRQQGF